MGFFEFDDTHGWTKPRREATYRWLTRWLQKRDDDGTEVSELPVLTPPQLRCTETGQVGTSFADAATVQSLNAARAEQMYPKRAAAAGKPLAALVRSRLGVAETGSAPRATVNGDAIELETEPGIRLTARLAMPAGGPARKAAVLYVGSPDAAAVDTLARDGYAVMVVAPRGWDASPNPRGGYSKAYQTAMRALLVGKTMPGMQTTDVLRAFAYLAGRSDIDGTRIRLMGKGSAAVLALFAALLERRIAGVTCEDLPPSYLELARLKMHEGVMDLVAPGVLSDFDIPDVVAALGNRVTRR
jgi:hypothetical protein